MELGKDTGGIEPLRLFEDLYHFVFGQKVVLFNYILQRHSGCSTETIL